MKTYIKTLLALCIVATSNTVPAQDVKDPPHMVFHDGMGMPGMPGPPVNFTKFVSAGSQGVIMGRLFPPMAIMSQQDNLDLSDKQVELIKNEMKTFQSEIVDIQWDLHAAISNMEKVLETDPIDLDSAQYSIDMVLDAENRMKRRHLTLLVKIHNVLTPTQQEKMKSLHGMHFGGFKKIVIDGME